MKSHLKLLIPLVLILNGFLLHAQNFEWVGALAGSNLVEGKLIANDPSGNIYVAGLFTGTADFDPGPGVTSLSSAGGYDIFITKFNAAGALQWAQRIGGAGSEDIAAMAVDAAGSIYITGVFSGTVDFDPGPGETILVSQGSDDIFILKLNTSGTLTYAKRIGGFQADVATGIAVDASGNVFVSGGFIGNNVDLDPGPGTALFSTGTNAITFAFILKLDNSGNYVLARAFGVSSSQSAAIRTLKLDSSGEVFVVGAFGNATDIDPGAGTVFVNTADGQSTLVKYSSALNYVWHSTFCASSNFVNDIVVDAAGNILLAGRFNGTCDFDPGPGVVNLTASGTTDAFAMKLSSTGSFVWARNFGSTQDDYANRIATDAAGNAYIGGYYWGNQFNDFDPGPGTANFPHGSNGYDGYILKLNSSGNYEWAYTFYGPFTNGLDNIQGILVDASNNIYATGYITNGTVDFDPGPGTTTITASASTGFVLKWNQNVLLNQSITFNSLAARTFGDAPFVLSATASSGLPVSYSSSNTSVATVSGSTVTVVGAGTSIITAMQGGNASYHPAPNVQQTLTVNKANQTITFGALSARTFGDAPFALAATSSSGLSVSYSSSNTSVATVSGNTVTIVGAGTTTITASQAGNANFNAATNVQQTLTVNKANQTITFGALSARNFGDAPFALAATSSSGLSVSYSSSNTSVATVSGNTVTIVGAGSTTITASQAGNANYNAASNVQQTLTINKANQTITFGALIARTFGDAPFALTATASSGLSVSYSSSNTSVATVSGNTVTIVGAGTTTITASQAGNTNYNAASNVQQNLVINKAGQTITFGSLSARTFGDAPFALAATSSSGLSVSYSSSNTSVATVSGNTVTIVGAGITMITASQAGNANYFGATDVQQMLTINKANQTITFGALAARSFGDVPFALAATSSSGLSVSYSSSNTSVATVSGNTVTIVGAGSTTITASQAGNTNYNAATNVQQTLTVNKANQTITFGALSARTFGDAPFALTATASSGLSVSYSSSNTSVATVSGNTVTIVGAGSTTITASQAGNTNYNAATNVQQTLTVNKANQTITFGALSARTFGDTPFALAATASSGLSVSYSSSNTSVATVSGNTVTIVGAGTTTITASQAGNTNYNAATNVQQTLTVNKASQTISFLEIGAKNVSDAPFALSATASSGLSVSYSSSNTNVATISGNTATIIGVGSTTITATQSGNTNYLAATPVERTLVVNSKLSQDISFAALPDKTFGDAAFNLLATASSSLPVSFSSSNTSVATISGNTVTIVGAGTTVITATQPGNSEYNEASPVERVLTINKAQQTISFAALSDVRLNTGSLNLEASASSGLTVVFSSSDNAVASVAGNALSLHAEGTVTITASQPGNSNYLAADNVERVLLIYDKLNQSIEFAELSPKTFGDADFQLNATSTSGLNVVYSSSNTSVATINGSTVSIVGAGTSLITASQPGNADYKEAVPTDRILTVKKAKQTISFNEIGEKQLTQGKIQLNASSSSGLTINYSSSNDEIASVSGNTVTLHKAGTVTITASQPGNVNYEAAEDIERSLVIVDKEAQTITFAEIPEKTFGDADFELNATASSGLSVSYSSSNANVATVTGNVVKIIGAGTANITASQEGDDDYFPAQAVVKQLIVNKASQSITFAELPVKDVSDVSMQLNASTSSGLPVNYSSSNTAVATIAGNVVSFVAAGTTKITATQPGNSNYNAADPVERTLTVTMLTRILSLSGDLSFGDVLLGAQTTKTLSIGNTGNSVLTVNNIQLPEGFSASLSSGTVPAGGNINVTITFNPTRIGDFNGSIVVVSNATEGVNERAVSGKGISITSVDNVLSTQKVRAYPNPGNGIVHLEFDGFKEMPESVSVVELTGRVIEQIRLSPQGSHSYMADFSSLNAGVYYIRINQGSKLYTIKYVKVK